MFAAPRSPLVIFAALALALLVACEGDPPAEPTPTSTPTASATPTAEATSTPVPTSTATPATNAPPTATGTAEAAPTVEGVFTEPRETQVARVIDIGEPESPFPDVEWPGQGSSTLIFDFETGEVYDGGPGSFAIFTADSRYALWTSGGWFQGTVMIRDLETGEERELAQNAGVFAYRAPPDADQFVIQRGNERSFVDLETGELRPVTGDPPGWPPPFPGGEYWEAEATDEHIPLGNYAVSVSHYRLMEADGSPTSLEFRATTIRPAGGTDFVLAAPPHVNGEERTTNLFLVDIEERIAEFIATSQLLLQIPMAANERYVAWNELYCNYESDQTRSILVYDRGTGAVTELDSRLTVVDLRDHYLGLSRGGFGVDAWLNLETMEWGQALRGDTIHVQWSPDRRYASVGQFGGHGGLCG